MSGPGFDSQPLWCQQEHPTIIAPVPLGRWAHQVMVGSLLRGRKSLISNFHCFVATTLPGKGSGVKLEEKPVAGIPKAVHCWPQQHPGYSFGTATMCIGLAFPMDYFNYVVRRTRFLCNSLSSIPIYPGFMHWKHVDSSFSQHEHTYFGLTSHKSHAATTYQCIKPHSTVWLMDSDTFIHPMEPQTPVTNIFPPKSTAKYNLVVRCKQ